MLLLGLGGLVAPGAAAQERFHPALDPQHFPVPDSLRPNIAFWRDIFATYDSNQTVVHDNWNVDVVFAVVDVRDLVRSGAPAVVIELTMRNRVRDEVEKYERVLRRLAGETRVEADASDLERVRALYAASSRPTGDFKAAAERVRGQQGLRDTFAEAIQRSGMFMPGIERILAQHGLPPEIRCLPFVESMFNYRARSKVGASGVWQFTASTGRLFLHMDSAVDARHDVWLAADAAARMLKADYARVNSWPLALTGYNHGIAGMARAVEQLGTTDMGVIADQYESRSFGFASRNFYSEFVAAVTVFAERATLFPGVEPMAEVGFDEFTPTRFVSLLDLASLTGTGVETLAVLNPALDDDVVAGRLLVPGTYPLRVPRGSVGSFEAAFAQLPSSRKPGRQVNRTHRVARGDTLSGIARKFGTTAASLQRANGMGRSTVIRVGQVLEVGSGGAWTPLVWTPPATQRAARSGGGERTHVIRAGETLHQIARQYGLTVAAISAANNLASPHRIFVGRVLSIPAP